MMFRSTLIADILHSSSVVVVADNNVTVYYVSIRLAGRFTAPLCDCVHGRENINMA